MSHPRVNWFQTLPADNGVLQGRPSTGCAHTDGLPSVRAHLPQIHNTRQAFPGLSPLSTPARRPRHKGPAQGGGHGRHRHFLAVTRRPSASAHTHRLNLANPLHISADASTPPPPPHRGHAWDSFIRAVERRDLAQCKQNGVGSDMVLLGCCYRGPELWDGVEE